MYFAIEEAEKRIEFLTVSKQNIYSKATFIIVDIFSITVQKINSMFEIIGCPINLTRRNLSYDGIVCQTNLCYLESRIEFGYY